MMDTRTLQAYLDHRSINSTTRYAALALQVQKHLGASVVARDIPSLERLLCAVRAIGRIGKYR